MIHSLLGVCLICMGVGAKASTPINSYRHTKEKQNRIVLQEENSQEEQTGLIPYTRTLDIATVEAQNFEQLQSSINFTPQNNDVEIYYNSIKTKITAENFQAFYVNGQVIDQNLIFQDNYTTPEDFGVAIPSAGHRTGETTSLMVLQLSPQAWIAESQINIEMRFVGRFNNLQNPDYGTIQFKAQILNSTLDTWQRYVDILNYYPYRQNYQIYNALTNGELGTNFIQQERAIQINLDNQTTTFGYEFTANLTLANNTTNYIVCYIEPYIVYPGAFSDPYYLVQTNEESHAPQNPSGRHMNIFTGGTTKNGFRELTISGYYAVPPSNYEVVDIPGLMWEILSMPFAFISTAFNLTLFPNTPYQVNISNLVLMVFGVLVFLFIFKLILKK